MKDKIHNRIWELSPDVTSGKSYLELVRLTEDLIKKYDEQGRLSNDPFNPTRERTISVPFLKIKKELKGRVCIVTGGLGCVGSILVNELLKFDVKQVIILDKQNDIQFINTEKVISLPCDICDFEMVRNIFLTYQPDIVFHTAAIRDPGYSESHIAETVATNVFGTINIIKACEEGDRVTQLVYSSTGKASRYFTEEVYAGTKKLSEFILDTYARKSRVKYSMVRFTHILDNSLMNIELKNKSMNEDHLAIHSPGKYVTAQNATEAAHLMLNALVYSKEKQCRFLIVRNLEWPVESLEMALYYIKKSGRDIPVIFLGNPLGYTEKFFRGQLDWSKPEELNLLINVYELKDKELNEANDIVISSPCSVSIKVLTQVLEKLEMSRGEADTRQALIEGLAKVVEDSLKMVDKKETINILKWGLDTQFLEFDNARISDFGRTIPLLRGSLENSKFCNEVEGLIYQTTRYAIHRTISVA
jgi:nucleoside-diphosphate-sugar epimerase